MLDLLRQSVDEFGQTVVIVTHDPKVAAVADRVIVLADGQVAADRRCEGEDEVIEPDAGPGLTGPPRES